MKKFQIWVEDDFTSHRPASSSANIESIRLWVSEPRPESEKGNGITHMASETLSSV